MLAVSLTCLNTPGTLGGSSTNYLLAESLAAAPGEALALTCHNPLDRKAPAEGENKECAEESTKAWRPLPPAALGGDRQALSTPHFPGPQGCKDCCAESKALCGDL